jgi:hypothetical protein
MKHSLRLAVRARVGHRSGAAPGPELTTKNKQTDGYAIRRSTKGAEQAGKNPEVQSTPLSFVRPSRIPHWASIEKATRLHEVAQTLSYLTVAWLSWPVSRVRKAVRRQQSQYGSGTERESSIGPLADHHVRDCFTETLPVM